MAAYAALVSLNFMIDQIQQLRLRKKPHLKPLQEKVTFLQDFLQNYSQRISQEIDQELETQITQVCYAAEDLIESHMLDRILKKSRNQVKKNSVLLSQELHKLLEAFDSIKGKATQMLDIAVDQSQIFRSFKLGGIARSSPVVEINMVGFDEHLIEVMKRITSDAYRLQIHPVVGMGGLGKTTLARNVFDHQLIKDHFQIRLWGTISQSYSVRDIFVSFLGDLGISPNVKTSTVNELGDRLYKTLSGRMYLIVLDDVWSVDVWDAIRRFFPDNSNGSRIILTTRLLNIASVIGSCQPYQLKFLSEAESWNLLRQIVFAEGGFPSAIEDIGRKIATRCKGLPLAIVVIGGLLAMSDMGRESLEFVERSLNSVVNSENDDYCLKILSLSYDNLPLHLQPCFLYMGVFPEDSEIRVSKLVKLWVAEGFLKPIEDKCLEDSAVEYLRDLVERNLIFVSKRGFSGKMKTCRIHDLLRDLCIRKAQEQKFLCFRRFHSLHMPAGLEAKPQQNIFRSAIEDEKDGSFLYPLRSTNIRFTSLKLLNELNVVDRNSPEKNLLLLSSRCLTLSANNISTPASLASVYVLWNLQTLLMSEMPGNEPIVLPHQIWEMLLLRHLQVQLLVLPYPSTVKAFLYGKARCVLVNMQTLSDVQNFEFSEEVLRRIPNIKKLKVTYTRGSVGMQWPFHLLHKLESLSFSVHRKVSMGRISLPQSLKKLLLDGGEIPWKEMTIVGSLPHLESLYLQNDAFYGEVWVPNEDEFTQLKSLHLKRMSLEHLEAEKIHFPRLESLVLVDLWKMKEIPHGIGDITTLRFISLEFCSSSLVNSAEQIKEDQEDNGNSDIQVQHHLTCGARDQLEEKLEKDFSLFKAFLEDTSMERRKDKKLSKLARQMRDLMHEAEDIIDTFAVSQPAETKSGKYFLKLYDIAKEVEIICTRIKEMYNDNIGKLTIAADGVADEASEAPIVRQENIVGFEDEAEKLIGYLTEEKEQLDVISITGMPGLGKTTLARKIYRDPRLQYEFPTLIWVYISQKFTMKNIFLSILTEFVMVTEDVKHKTDRELARIVASHLQYGKFLIVMDDIRTPEDWEKLKIALPEHNKMGKVLITSRHMEVGRCANRDRVPHQLRFLTQDESWLLLRYEVFGKPEFPPELEIHGRLIVDRCDRLPLAIVVIGGILVRKVSATEDLAAMRSTWKKVSKNVNTHIVAENPTKKMEKIIALSYDKLPYHLRACFLYLGMFPEDFEIPAWNLTRMWIAEGFIQQKDGISLEDTAESYLDDLINRNLLRVDKRRRDGKVKTCRLHDMLRDFCRNEAGDKRENFLQEMKRSAGSFEPPVSNVPTFRRLCIHSNIMSFICSKPYGPRVRSFVCFSKEEINLPSEYISSIPAYFKLLRVLEVKPIKFTKIPSDMYQLVHMRYIAISFNLAILPQAFSKLWNLQTLIVDTTQRTLEIRADIWKMNKLRHLKTNASATLPKTGKGSLEGENIQTLGTISPQSCSDAVFEKARYVKKLGIRGRLAMLMDSKNGSFDSLGKLGNLEKLKLLNDVFPSPPSEGQLRSLPPPYQFPPKLRSLALADTFLDWAHMSIIGLLENLEVLKLKDKAFMGKSWEAADGGFRKLEVLYIGRTDLVIWMASKHHFPRLRTLELRNCEELQKVPIELADIPSFQMLDVYRSKFAAASAKAISERKREIQNGKTTKSNTFKLTIFPPEE